MMKFNYSLWFCVSHKQTLHYSYGIIAYSTRLLVMWDILLDTRYPNFALFIQGDLQYDCNNCNLRKQLIQYRELLSCFTVENKTLDHFCRTIKGPFCAFSHGLLNTIWSCHNTNYPMVIIPKNCKLIKQFAPQSDTGPQQWSPSTYIAPTLKTVWTLTVAQYVSTSPSVRKPVYFRKSLCAMVTPNPGFQRSCRNQKNKKIQQAYKSGDIIRQGISWR